MFAAAEEGCALKVGSEAMAGTVTQRLLQQYEEAAAAGAQAAEGVSDGTAPALKCVDVLYPRTLCLVM
jgi:hypothetical protein